MLTRFKARQMSGSAPDSPEHKQDPCTNYCEDDPLVTLTGSDPCPDCGVKVCFHAHRPAAPVIPAPALPPAPRHAGSPFIKLHSLLPKWNNKSTCRPFLEQLTLILSTQAAHVDKAEWINVFPTIVDDLPSLKWITTNIVVASPNNISNLVITELPIITFWSWVLFDQLYLLIPTTSIHQTDIFGKLTSLRVFSISWFSLHCWSSRCCIVSKISPSPWL
jgi:hypothetical protein